jgi:hypothetical protein
MSYTADSKMSSVRPKWILLQLGTQSGARCLIFGLIRPSGIMYPMNLTIGWFQQEKPYHDKKDVEQWFEAFWNQIIDVNINRSLRKLE